MKREAIFKTYHQDQLSLLPPSLEELIPEVHPRPNSELDHRSNRCHRTSQGL